MLFSIVSRKTEDDLLLIFFFSEFLSPSAIEGLPTDMPLCAVTPGVPFNQGITLTDGQVCQNTKAHNRIIRSVQNGKVFVMVFASD